MNCSRTKNKTNEPLDHLGGQFLVLRCILSSVSVWLYPGGTISSLVAVPHSIVYKANLSVSRSFSRHCCWEQGEFPAAVSKLWPGLESSVNYCVSQRGVLQGWAPSRQGNFLDSSSFKLIEAFGLATWPFSPLWNVPHFEANTIHSTVHTKTLA